MKYYENFIFVVYGQNFENLKENLSIKEDNITVLPNGLHWFKNKFCVCRKIKLPLSCARD